MNAGVNFLREHVQESVRIHYVITDGGKAPNIVPDYSKVWYFVRDANRKGLEDVYQRVLKCAEGASLMTETSYEVNLIGSVYEYLPNHTISAVLDENLRMVGPPQFTDEEIQFAYEMQKNLDIPEEGLNSKIEKFEEPKSLTGGSTDCAHVSWIVPTAGELKTVCAPVGIPWHSWAVTSSSASSIGFKGMSVAAKTIAASGIDILTDKKIVENARKEFAEKTEGFTYKSAIPPGQKPPLPED